MFLHFNIELSFCISHFILINFICIKEIERCELLCKILIVFKLISERTVHLMGQ